MIAGFEDITRDDIRHKGAVMNGGCVAQLCTP